jgi:uncharacterized membrane protein YczE
VLLSRPLKLVCGCVVLGVGVGLLLVAELGSDGYSTLLRGVSLATGLPYAAVNWSTGALFVAVAWWRGQRPGPGTLVQPLLVGATVSTVLDVADGPHGIAGRAGLMLLAFALVGAGVALYLASGLGAGPVEAAARAADPPLPFRVSYAVVQGGGALVGWLLGAPIGAGTILVAGGTGLVVARLLPLFQGRATRERYPPAALPSPRDAG